MRKKQIRSCFFCTLLSIIIGLLYTNLKAQAHKQSKKLIPEESPKNLQICSPFYIVNGVRNYNKIKEKKEKNIVISLMCPFRAFIKKFIFQIYVKIKKLILCYLHVHCGILNFKYLDVSFFKNAIYKNY